MSLTADEVLALPWVQPLRPRGNAYRGRLSEYSDLEVWHVPVVFKEWVTPPDLLQRWSDKKTNSNESWGKRPLAVGEASGCRYSCGEVELAARLRAAGFQSYWMSEWDKFPHVPCWERFCVKRNELEDRLPELWAADHNLRVRAESRDVDLGKRGGHPDVAAWKTGNRDFVHVEYKGPNDKMKDNQDRWAGSLLHENRDRFVYVVAKGVFEP